MENFFGSVRRSIVFRSPGGEESGGFGDKITSLRKSMVGFLAKQSISTRLLPLPPSPGKETVPTINWRKGELIGFGAFGHVYMGMNLDSGELLAVKQVSIPANCSLRDKAQSHVRELEDEIKLLKNLSHPNIVRYLGTAREEESLNIMLEFVPGGSISSLLGKFGSFPEPVIRMYTKQLLQGLEYLHQHGIIHRDIKGANILVDNKGCIKLADFGASKQVVELATVTGAKSMKGTPYWMAPEVIRQTGHSFSADIWSVGCTVIEMATGKPPWSQQYQEVAALFHIGTTMSHPPIPEHLSPEAKDFLSKCLQKDPNLRPNASDLLKHPFVTDEYRAPLSNIQFSVMEQSSTTSIPAPGVHPILNESFNMVNMDNSTTFPEELSGHRINWATNASEDMCELGETYNFRVNGSVKSSLTLDPFCKSFNPMSEPLDDWPCKFEESPEQRPIHTENLSEPSIIDAGDRFPLPITENNGFTFPCGPTTEDDEEVTETKIRAFLDEKALDLKKLQTPLYEFYNTMNASCHSDVIGKRNEDGPTNCSQLPLKSPSRLASRTASPVEAMSPNRNRRISNNGVGIHSQVLKEIPNNLNECRLLNSPDDPHNQRCSEIQRKWKEELDQELQRQREMMRQVGVVGKICSSPRDKGMNRPRDRLRFASPEK